MIDPRNLDTLLHPTVRCCSIKGSYPDRQKHLVLLRELLAVRSYLPQRMLKSGMQEARKSYLVRLETSPEDITGMKASQGILTVRGGMTSHAAVVARGMGTCCVSGCGDIAMDEANKKFTLAGKEYHEGDYISIDGSTGNIYDGAIPTVDATIAGEFGRIMAWADEFRTHESSYQCRYSGRC